MKKCLIITNYQKDENLTITMRIRKYLEERGCECVVAPESLCRFHERRPEDDLGLPEDIEAVIVLGGDGTLIQAAHDMIDYNLPFFGVNLGTLGYLTEVGKDNIYTAMDALVDDSFEIEERMMLEGRLTEDVSGNGGYPALNDIVISRVGGLRVVNYDIYVNDKFLSTYQADGIIVSTPTGSTGYNMSAGGPVVSPCAQLSVVTPICPHTLSNRSIVLDSEDKISICVQPQRSVNSPEAMVSFDAARSLEINGGDYIEIRKSSAVTKFIKINKYSFLQNLGKKMWL